MAGGGSGEVHRVRTTGPAGCLTTCVRPGRQRSAVAIEANPAHNGLAMDVTLASWGSPPGVGVLPGGLGKVSASDHHLVGA